MLYITYVDLNSKPLIGIKKKVLAQLDVFRKHYGRGLYTTYCGQMLYLMEYNNILRKEIAITKKECAEVLLNWIKEFQIDKVYIRYDYSDQWFLNFGKKLRENKVTSVIEIPTYPYDREIQNKRILCEDGYYREQLFQYYSCVTTYGIYKDIWNIPVITLVNGVDINEHPLQVKERNDGKIVLIAVASMAKWHGYERVIMGLADYYRNNGDKEVIFKLVGDGPEINMYKSLTKKYNLENAVEFCGSLVGEKLEEQYAMADVGIGSLGWYKVGVDQAAPIKLLEYCARGIPMVFGYKDLSFIDEKEYALRVENNSTPIDIEKIIIFYNKLKENQDYQITMRSYVKDKYTWQKILCPVLEYFDKKTT